MNRLRAIHIFPKFIDARPIHEIRAKYDGLHSFIAPHVTLVFPFVSDITSAALEQHVQNAVRAISPFALVLQSVTGAEGGYLFLNVKRGNDEIIKLHDQLYTGLLRNFLNRNLTYMPHLTVGRIEDASVFQLALSETESFVTPFATTVDEIAIESIADNGASTMEAVIRLD
ncbi:2'-5' RNA ligase family protein [Alicyclobacillus fodiniaquatilis]|uniref:2'-5' RNA ligase family protein n=1 Tax=Alicyclobacillus fodiniaquatilis TaxID=1661150 RepID=A0ABW4JGI4_9BACL